MDFIKGLPLVQGKKAILVIVDRFTKFAHFLALEHRFITQQVAQLLFSKILELYGMPKSIVRDRDRIFLSEFWQKLFQLQGTMLKHCTAYHYQSDWQAERINQCSETYLCCFCYNKLQDWAKWLLWALYWYNTTWKTSTSFTPYKALYGRPPLTILQYIPKAARVQAVAHTL